MEIRNNKLNGADFAELTSLYPNLYKLKVGANPIKSLDVFKALSKLQSLKKVELQDTEPSQKTNYRQDLFKLLSSLESVDGKDKKGGDVESTINDEDDEYDEEDAEFNDEDFEDDDEEEDFEDDDDDDEEEQRKTKKSKKA